MGEGLGVWESTLKGGRTSRVFRHVVIATYTTLGAAAARYFSLFT